MTQAIIRALETTPINSVPLVIKSDSEYAIKCIFFSRIVATLFLTEYLGFTDWLPTWRRNNFTTSQGTPVKNVKLIMYMDALFSTRGRSGQEVRLEHVRGHAGEVGNEGADALAVHGAKLPDIDEPDWDALRLQLEKVPVSVESADSSVSRLRILRPRETALKTFVGRCTLIWCLMKMIFLQSSRQRRLGTVFIIIIDSVSNAVLVMSSCVTQRIPVVTRASDRSHSVMELWKPEYSGSNDTLFRLGGPSKLSRGHVTPVSHLRRVSRNPCNTVTFNRTLRSRARRPAMRVPPPEMAGAFSLGEGATDS